MALKDKRSRQERSQTVDELVERIKSGDRDAFEEFFTQTQPALLRYLFLIGAADPSDVAQEAWISLSKALVEFEGSTTGLRALLFHIARRRQIDEIRRTNRRPASSSLHGDVDQYGTYFLADEHSDLEDALKHLVELPEVQREIVALRVFLDFTPAEVAVQVGRSEGYVRVNYHRAMKSLERSFKAIGAVDGNVSAQCNNSAMPSDLTDIQA